MGRIMAVNISEKKGTQKKNVHSAKLIEDWGIENDAHAGKWHRQVSLLSYEKIEDFKAKGAPVDEGAFGEKMCIRDRRVALARIFLSSPRVLMLDEPFSALDGYLRWNLEQELLETLKEFGGPTLFVSHSRDEVYRICDRVCVMDKDSSSPVIPVKQLFEAPESRAAAPGSYTHLCHREGEAGAGKGGCGKRALGIPDAL